MIELAWVTITLLLVAVHAFSTCKMTFFDPVVDSTTLLGGRHEAFDACGESYEVYIGFTVLDDSSGVILLPETITGQNLNDWGLVYSSSLSYSSSTESRTNEQHGDLFSGTANPKTWVRYYLKYEVTSGSTSTAGSMNMKLYRGMLTNEDIVANPPGLQTHSQLCIDFVNLAQSEGKFDFKIKSPCVLDLAEVVGLIVLSSHKTNLLMQSIPLEPADIIQFGTGKVLQRHSGLLIDTYMKDLINLNDASSTYLVQQQKGFYLFGIDGAPFFISPDGHAERKMSLTLMLKLFSGNADLEYTTELFQDTSSGKESIVKIKLVHDSSSSLEEMTQYFTVTYVDETDNTLQKKVITKDQSFPHFSIRSNYILKFIFSEKSLESTGTLTVGQHLYKSNTVLYVFACFPKDDREVGGMGDTCLFLVKTKIRNADRIITPEPYRIEITEDVDSYFYLNLDEIVLYQGGVDDLLIADKSAIVSTVQQNPYTTMDNFVDGCYSKNLFTGHCNLCNRAISALDLNSGKCLLNQFGDQCTYKFDEETCAHCNEKSFFSDFYRRGGCISTRDQGCPKDAGAFIDFLSMEMTSGFCNSCPLNAVTCHGRYTVIIDTCSAFSVLSSNICSCTVSNCDLCFHEACSICSQGYLLHKEYNDVTDKIDSTCNLVADCISGWVPHYNNSILQFCFKDSCTIGYQFNTANNNCEACLDATLGSCGTTSISTSIGKKYALSKVGSSFEVTTVIDSNFDFCTKVNATNDCLECSSGYVIRRSSLYKTTCNCERGKILNPTTKACDDCPFGCNIRSNFR